ncbi:septum formation protein [Bacillus mesophilus]|uniref:dTTP/UTP pyrophosphatase n=1 Tax=Bacillus mesophilus TaxID=1808955 RepID=A0A6M0Q9R2_9BACI|nr:Maf family protein [Bacillus mesophilus]MBM7660654.1 septum formation protein [Bacillus mesophilus]NEY71798.1 septum formation inhibitor Maf [Bacillus mesophilus]
MQHLILASSSPRRKELLTNLGITFDVHSSTVEEIVDPSATAEETVLSLAQQKAMDVAKQYPSSYVIGADTIVVKDSKILGKPKDEQDAISTLKMLSGERHSVLTGVAIVHEGNSTAFYVKTDVTFWPLRDEEIIQYIRSGEPFDKAGSYGIQGLGSLFVKEISGDYFAVVGLPVSTLKRELEKIGFNF